MFLSIYMFANILHIYIHIPAMSNYSNIE